jgi:hypothetical protein
MSGIFAKIQRMQQLLSEVWLLVGVKWYYLETAGTSTIPLGSMRTGWIEKSVNSYYLRPEKEGTHPMGSMVTGSKDTVFL